MKKLSPKGVALILIGLLSPILLPLPGMLICYMIYPSAKAAEATQAIFSLSIGIGMIGWAAMAGFLTTYLLGKNGVTKILVYPLLILSICITMTAVISFIGRDRGKTFGSGLLGYSIPLSIGCLVGISALDGDRKKEALAKRMDWMK